MSCIRWLTRRPIVSSVAVYMNNSAKNFADFSSAPIDCLISCLMRLTTSSCSLSISVMHDMPVTFARQIGQLLLRISHSFAHLLHAARCPHGKKRQTDGSARHTLHVSATYDSGGTSESGGRSCFEPPPCEFLGRSCFGPIVRKCV